MLCQLLRDLPEIGLIGLLELFWLTFAKSLIVSTHYLTKFCHIILIFAMSSRERCH